MLKIKQRMQFDIAIAGGGAAGFFAAIAAAEANPELKIVLLEKGPNVLGKVKISGGGRCNVTHACFDPRQLVKYYPRGEKALLGPFHTFSAKDTIHFFESRGVAIKAEADGRMFPTTDDSQTIIDCLIGAANAAGVKIWTRAGVEEILFNEEDGNFHLSLSNKTTAISKKVLIATGSSGRIWEQLQEQGHNIIPSVPSLFTFNIKDKRIDGLAGISVGSAVVAVAGTKLKEQGPLLITHWGMSGPAILKLSAWGARILHDKNYSFNLIINLLPHMSQEEVRQQLEKQKQLFPKKQVVKNTFFNIPARLWQSLAIAAGVQEAQNWADISKKVINALIMELSAGNYKVEGKSTFKEEFVTAGGVDLKEVDFKTMQSKKVSNIYFAGEVLDIDAITGGFNFQSAWTTGYIAGKSMAENL